MKFIIKHLVKDNGSINLLFPGSKEQQGILIEERIITSIQLFREAAFFELICSVIPLRRFLTAARQRGICGLDLTGEHSSIMLRELDCTTIPDAPTTGWMSAFVRDYRTRLISLMAHTINEQNAPISSAVDKPVRFSAFEIVRAADGASELPRH
jgi:hypothetical protein